MENRLENLLRYRLKVVRNSRKHFKLKRNSSIVDSYKLIVSISTSWEQRHMCRRMICQDWDAVMIWESGNTVSAEMATCPFVHKALLWSAVTISPTGFHLKGWEVDISKHRTRSSLWLPVSIGWFQKNVQVVIMKRSHVKPMKMYADVCLYMNQPNPRV